MKVSGQFTIEFEQLDSSLDFKDNMTASRMSFKKIYTGELIGESKGEMLTLTTTIDGSAGYVALEQFQGSINELQGTFTLQHYGTMKRGKDFLLLEVIPDSGTQDFKEITGSMSIHFSEGNHFFEFDYTL